VRELLERPDSWGTAASEPRYASLEVAWQLLVAAKGEEPLLALRLIDLVGEIAIGIAAADPRAHLHRQLLVEVRCARTHRCSTRRTAAARAGSCAGPPTNWRRISVTPGRFTAWRSPGCGTRSGAGRRRSRSASGR
jgi:hypothetical protein